LKTSMGRSWIPWGET